MSELNGPTILTKPVDRDTLTVHQHPDGVYFDYHVCVEDQKRYNLVGIGFSLTSDELRSLAAPPPPAGDGDEVIGLARDLVASVDDYEETIVEGHRYTDGDIEASFAVLTDSRDKLAAALGVYPVTVGDGGAGVGEIAELRAIADDLENVQAATFLDDLTVNGAIQRVREIADRLAAHASDGGGKAR